MNYKEQLTDFRPETKKETAMQEKILAYVRQYGDNLLTRENENIHLTASAFLLNPAMDKTLMVYHKIYNSYCWTGGHTDGEKDLLLLAAREAMEETNLLYAFPLSKHILSVDILPVVEHVKNGKTIKAHQHLSAAYGFIAPENQSFYHNPKENLDVKWIPIQDLSTFCKESYMIPIYQKMIKRMKNLAQNMDDYSLCAIVPPLLTWYKKSARHLPWRENTEPYRVWVSEIMLQQTRVDTVIPYYNRFMERLPDLESLAKVPEETLLKLWEGLGYYSRVRNLQKAAQVVMEKHQGSFPEDYADILALPGIGTYTAGAISSIAFGQPEPAVDGNVLRVLSRLTENPSDIAAAATKQQMTEALRQIYPLIGSGDFTQALMELGALVCVPDTPRCEACPLSSLCKARLHQSQAQFPYKSKKQSKKTEQRTVFLLCWEDKVALRRREDKGLLRGLWEFPNLEGHLDIQEAKALVEDWGIAVAGIEKSIDQKHIFTHMVWEMQGYTITCQGMQGTGLTWVTRETLFRDLMLPSAFKAYSELLR